LLEESYAHPERATDYDLTAPLNAASFATSYTFASVLVQLRFSAGRLAAVTLFPVSLGYGESLRSSGTPRLERTPERVAEIFRQISERTTAFGLAPLDLKLRKGRGNLQIR
jgi:hypothetical protein